MTFPFFRSGLNEDESRLANFILDNFNVKRDLIERGYFASRDISKESEIEINILCIAFLCNFGHSLTSFAFISKEKVEIIEQTFSKVIVWMCHINHHYITTTEEGQLYFARTKLENYKNELNLCLRDEKDHLPWYIYNSIFYYPLQTKIVEENLDVKNQIKNFRIDLNYLFSDYTPMVYNFLMYYQDYLFKFK